MYQPQPYSKNIDQLVRITKAIYEKYGKFLKWTSQPESILDLGIGDGKMTENALLPFVPNNIKEYVGADITEVMLNSAHETVCHEKFRTVLLDGATKRLPIELHNRFHHIFANYSFQHISDTR